MINFYIFIFQSTSQNNKKTLNNGTFSSKPTIIRALSDPTNNMTTQQPPPPQDTNNEHEFKLEYQQQISNGTAENQAPDVITKITNKRMRKKQSRWTLIITFLSFVLIIIMITIAYLVSKGFLDKSTEKVCTVDFL